MKKLSCQEIREAWVKFFESKNHKHIASASLVPDNPTLLLNAAGMVQFVPIFMGTKPAPEPPRAVTVQKCARVGGKDSDLENIGRTTRHHSFFEMLGNFSFGDYFKAEAIDWAWDFVRNELGLEADKLYVSIFEGDDSNPRDAEAYDLWLKTLAKDFPDEEDRKKRIWEMSRKDNFWGPPGATGPCGPCSEIYYDTRHCEHSEAIQLGSEEFDNRFVEIWNLVFMQFFKDEEGKFTALEKKNIDTGAGLERIATILQGVNNSFETDELFKVLNLLAADLGTSYAKSEEHDLYLKIITDHLRCLSFLIADGVRPSNVGRGYVLRMIIRRAARFVYLLRNEASAFLYKHCSNLIDAYAAAYPELKANADSIISVCEKEEEAFAKTISNGLAILEERIEILTSQAPQDDKLVDGEFIFDLYSTYGFPLELSRDIVGERGLEVDLEGYEKAKLKHSEASSSGNFDTSVESNAYVAGILKEHGVTKFLGYDNDSSLAKVLAIEGNSMVLDQTPFYAESGGQLADTGVIASKAKQSNAKVQKVKNVEGIFIHTVDDASGLNPGDEVTASIDVERRNLTRLHHTTCHMLQAALRKVLGDQIQQMGSQVGPEYTRFDFNLDRAMTKDELEQTEKLVNDWIQAKLPVETKVMAYDDAIAAGALSFFEDKYDDEVRVLFVGEGDNKASIELCGGTHVSNLSEIGEVVLAQEGSVAAGIRRIKMLASDLAKQFKAEEVAKAKIKADEQAAQEAAKAEAKQRKQAQAKLVLAQADDLLAQASDNGEAKILILNLADSFSDELEGDAVKTLAEALLSKFENSGSKAFVFLAAPSSAKVTFMAAASQDLVKDKNSSYNASNAVRTAAQICGGGGGGRPNFAQAGGKNPDKIAEALEAVQVNFNIKAA
ncbi:MAG: alanine--tRNA ligase [Candidatus Melainabacteria bacterium]|nr:alanine--tRNA ligase [Candidatus Melainabacteria bacterium]